MADTTIDSRVYGALQGNSPVAPRGTSDELRENFMTLLVAQLQNQDPLNPVENAELTSHLAQINTVSGIDALNTTLNGITAQIETGQSLQAAALIGQGVLVPGTRLLVGEEGTSTPIGVELDSPAKQVTVKIIGPDGQVLKTLDAGAQPIGVEVFSWDGKLESGEFAPSGAYQVAVEAWAKDGSKLDARVLNYALVTGVSSAKGAGVQLDLGGITAPVGLQDVRKIF